jgi:hypothetical protein
MIDRNALARLIADAFEAQGETAYVDADEELSDLEDVILDGSFDLYKVAEHVLSKLAD